MKRRLLGEGKKSQKSIHDESIIMLQLNEGNHFFSFMNEKKNCHWHFQFFSDANWTLMRKVWDYA